MTVGLAFTIAMVIVAAAAGAGLRFLVAERLNGDFPTGTLVVNLAASLALGLIVGADDPVPTIVGIGALGALSTWSAAANEAAAMARSGRASLAIGYLGLSVSAGVLAAWFGLKLGALFF